MKLLKSISLSIIVFALAFPLYTYGALSTVSEISSGQFSPNQHAEQIVPKAIHIVVNGRDYNAKDVNALLVNGTMFVPLRFVGEELGYSVSWDEKSETADINDGAIVAVLGEYAITKYNTVSYPCPHPSFLFQGRFMIGLRQVASALNYTVDWDQETMTANLTRRATTAR